MREIPNKLVSIVVFLTDRRVELEGDQVVIGVMPNTGTLFVDHRQGEGKTVRYVGFPFAMELEETKVVPAGGLLVRPTLLGS